jgi:DUF1680 family protein
MGKTERSSWFSCSCCPTNDVRFIPEIAGYIYASRADALYVNLFIGGSAEATVAGTAVKLKQQTGYPFSGQVKLEVAPAKATTFTMNVRIPGWARNEPMPGDLYRYADGLKPVVKLAVNGKPEHYELKKGYAELHREWREGDVVTLDLEMPVRQVVSHEKVKTNTGCVALERGPLVYCAEGADNDGKVLNRSFTGKVKFHTAQRPDLLGGVTTIQATSDADDGKPLSFIPYYAWCHRGPNEMRVWIPASGNIKQP